MRILSIETSCDETAAAVTENGTVIIRSAVASSAAMYKKWGGIVPEIAAREQLESMIPMLIDVLSPLTTAHTQPIQTIKNSIDAIAVTIGPGLIGSLLIGVETAKTLAYLTQKSLIPINHVIAHMYANFITHEPTIENKKPVEFPAISLVVSGGHTELYLMESEKHITWLGGTIDDAAGEAFDKTARLLGFENKGGPAIEHSATEYVNKNKRQTFNLPRPYLSDQPYNFSFSGLKTAVLREIEKQKRNDQLNSETIGQLAYEVQESITDVLVKKTLLAVEQKSAKSILLSGGVAANKRLRDKMSTATNVSLHSPPLSLCTDNAATIGSCAFYIGQPQPWHSIHANPSISVELEFKK